MSTEETHEAIRLLVLYTVLGTNMAINESLSTCAAARYAIAIRLLELIPDDLNELLPNDLVGPVRNVLNILTLNQGKMP